MIEPPGRRSTDATGAAHAAYLDATEEFHRALLDFAMEGVAPEDGG